MNVTLKWCRRVFLTAFLLAIAAWLYAEGAQWLLRWRAEKLLADIQALEVNRSSWSDAQRLMRRWGRWGDYRGTCTAESCEYGIGIAHVLPERFRGYPDAGVKNWLPRLMDHLGQRSAVIAGGFSVERGKVTKKSFMETITLPVQVWFARGGAYVPELFVSSTEYERFSSDEDDSRLRSHIKVRNLKGPWGLRTQFSSQVEPVERAALMSFQFSCITRFSGCLSERDILPEGWRMLEEKRHKSGQRRY
jgi:hypothetical protein